MTLEAAKGGPPPDMGPQCIPPRARLEEVNAVENVIYWDLRSLLQNAAPESARSPALTSYFPKPLQCKRSFLPRFLKSAACRSAFFCVEVFLQQNSCAEPETSLDR
jgi:hypothetical protein